MQRPHNGGSGAVDAMVTVDLSNPAYVVALAAIVTTTGALVVAAINLLSAVVVAYINGRTQRRLEVVRAVRDYRLGCVREFTESADWIAASIFALSSTSETDPTQLRTMCAEWARRYAILLRSYSSVGDIDWLDRATDFMSLEVSAREDITEAASRGAVDDARVAAHERVERLMTILRSVHAADERLILRSPKRH